MKRVVWILIACVFFSCLSFFIPSTMEAKVYTKEEISTIEEAGTYPVRVYTKDEKGNDIESIFYVTLTFPNTVVSKANGEGIDASDFEVKKGKTLTDQEVIDFANARAWSLGDGSEIPITKVVRNERDGTLSEVSFMTEKGTTVTVKEIETVGESLFTNEEFMYLHTGSMKMVWENLGFSQLTLLIIILLVCPVLLVSILFFLLQQKINRIKRLLFSKKT